MKFFDRINRIKKFARARGDGLTVNDYFAMICAMKVVPINLAWRNVSKILDVVVTVTRHGIPIAKFMPIDEVEECESSAASEKSHGEPDDQID